MNLAYFFASPLIATPHRERMQAQMHQADYTTDYERVRLRELVMLWEKVAQETWLNHYHRIEVAGYLAHFSARLKKLNLLLEPAPSS